MLCFVAMITVYHGHSHFNPLEINNTTESELTACDEINPEILPEVEHHKQVIFDLSTSSDKTNTCVLSNGEGDGKENGTPKSPRPVKSPGCKVMFKDNELVTVSKGKIVHNDAQALQQAIRKGQQNRKVEFNVQPSIENEEHPGGIDPRVEENSTPNQKSETNYMLPDSTNVIIKSNKPKGHNGTPGQ